MRFGKYRLLQRIAGGGMGEVHLAKLKGPSGFEKLVVIKRLLGRHQHDTKYITMFFREAKVAAQLTHSNIVQIYEVGYHQGIPYMAMEYVRGKSLRNLIDRLLLEGQTLAWAYAISIIQDLCAGLSFAHNARHLSGIPMGLIHRDINPHNILISYQGQVKIIDFGIAKSELTLEQTQAGTIKGTVIYMSPEQSSGYPLDKRSDLFSVGICLYETLTGVNPFRKSTMGASLAAIRHTDYPALTSYQEALEPFEPILAKALARLPQARYSDGMDLAAQLQDLVDSGKVGKVSMGLADYLQNLFSDAIAEEDRLLTQTELVEIPLKDSASFLDLSASLADEFSRAQTVKDDRLLAELTQWDQAQRLQNLSPHPDATPAPTTRLRSVGRPVLSYSLLIIAWVGLGMLAYRMMHTPLFKPSAKPTLADPTQPLIDPAASVPPAASPPSVTPAPLPAHAPMHSEEAQPHAFTPHHPSKHRGSHTSHRFQSKAQPKHDHPTSGVGTLKILLDPPLLFLGASTSESLVKLKKTRDLIHIGSTKSSDKNSFRIKIRYRIEPQAIYYTVESQPWANVYGAGGMALGRTPLPELEGGTWTVFEFRNPRINATQRITLGFTRM